MEEYVLIRWKTEDPWFALPTPMTPTRGKQELIPPTHWAWRDHSWQQAESPGLPVFKEEVCKSRTLLGTQREDQAMPCGAIYA